MKSIYCIEAIIFIIFLVVIDRRIRAILMNNDDSRIKINFFKDKIKALNNVFKKNKKEFNKLFQNKKKLHMLILLSFISVPLVFFILYYIFLGIDIELIKAESITFAMGISIILGIVIYFSKISKVGFKTFLDNLNSIDNFIYEKTGFKKIEWISNKNEYLYEKNINDYIMNVNFEINYMPAEYFGKTIWHKASISVIKKDSNEQLDIENNPQIQELLDKYAFLNIKNKDKRISSSLIFLTSSHKRMLTYLYSVITLANEITNIDFKK